jgi:hypothetical protein
MLAVGGAAGQAGLLALGRNPPAKRLGPEPGQSRQVVRVGGTRDVTPREIGMRNSLVGQPYFVIWA